LNKQERDTRRAVLLDQHPLWLEAVEHSLARLGIVVVGKAVRPSDALALLDQHAPDLFVTEVSMMPGDLDGFGCLRLATEHVPEMRTIVLSMYDDAETIADALSAGASAYVVKTAHPDDFASAVRQAFYHTIYFADTPEQAEPAATDNAAELADLTHREVEILLLVAEGLANAELARKLYVTEQTVKFHLSNIYRKLGVSNRTEASRWAQVKGLLPSVRPVQSSAA
jgi:DNA-binding NarL/FixJ family response regulator